VQLSAQMAVAIVVEITGKRSLGLVEFATN